ncbi:MAG TPA: ADP-ribosylation factor-like protein [Candidatus Limnocylindrales bacterium]|nr:ADP-ribosylation factor-like protein [Candidatus Limnocylindrales bacterium]
MAQFNYSTKEIIAKLVYYGPSLGGKTTNLQVLHKILDPTSRGNLFSLETEADRTLFFDLLPINLGIRKGIELRLKVYTVPGQVKYNSTRRMVLTGADGIVFVADSGVSRYNDNIESFQNLIENLAVNSINIHEIPLVLQYNKRDLPDILSVETLEKKLNFRNVPSFESVAIEGKGVLESFIGILKGIMIHFAEKYHLAKGEAGIARLVEQVEKNLMEHVQKGQKIQNSVIQPQGSQVHPEPKEPKL